MIWADEIRVEVGKMQTTKTLKPSIIMLAALIAQVLVLVPLWNHESTSGAFLGRYSTGYGLAVIGFAMIAEGWLILYVLRGRVFNWLAGRSARLLQVVIVLSGVVVFAGWLAPIESSLQNALAVNWLFFSVILIVHLPESSTVPRSFWLAVWLITGALVLLLILSALVGLPYSPDEAHWADYGTSPFVLDGLYSRTWINAPMPINPGLGWSVAAYGWLLENTGYDLRIGRIWNIVSYLVAFAGIGALTMRLYGRYAAAISVIVALLSAVFLPELDYRPDHQLAAVVIWTVYCVVMGRTASRFNGLWHLGAGLLATLSLQLHAAGVYLAMTVSLYYGINWLFSSIKERSMTWRAFYPLLMMALGAAIGTVVYFLLNVMPVGGLGVFVSTLVSERFSSDRSMTLERLNWPSVWELSLILSGVAYMLWRHSQADRVLLWFASLFTVVILLFDTWGYRMQYQSLAFVAAGALVAGAFSQRRLWITGVILLVLAGQVVGDTVNWRDMRPVLNTGTLPPPLLNKIGDAVAPYVNDDDVFVSSHELIWTFHHHPAFYSTAGEITGFRRWHLSGPAAVWSNIRQGSLTDIRWLTGDTQMVWDHLRPTVVASISGPIILTPGLLRYMQANNFQVCEKFAVDGAVIQIYRMVCP